MDYEIGIGMDGWWALVPCQLEKTRLIICKNKDPFAVVLEMKWPRDSINGNAKQKRNDEKGRGDEDEICK